MTISRLINCSEKKYCSTDSYLVRLLLDNLNTFAEGKGFA